MTTITHPDQLAKIRESEINEPVFRNIGQALWVAYALEHFRESPKTTLMTLLNSINDGQYNEPIKLTGINMSGMSDLEKHAQAAFIRAAVCDLPKIPRCYVQGAYSLTEQRRKGMLEMARYIGERIEGRDRLYSGPITWHILAPPKDRKQASVAMISGKFQVPIRSVERDIADAKMHLRMVKEIAFEMLRGKFSGTGLIP